MRNYLAILPTSEADKMNMEMTQQTKKLYEERARIIKAMAHPTRLFMVDVLSKGERCVCELRDMVGADISTVSKHLSVLKQAGIVEDDKRGLQVWYSLKVPCILKFFGCVEDVIKARTGWSAPSSAR
jgi:ArsR family transcriptional regulator